MALKNVHAQHFFSLRGALKFPLENVIWEHRACQYVLSKDVLQKLLHIARPRAIKSYFGIQHKFQFVDYCKNLGLVVPGADHYVGQNYFYLDQDYYDRITQLITPFEVFPGNPSIKPAASVEDAGQIVDVVPVENKAEPTPAQAVARLVGWHRAPLSPGENGSYHVIILDQSEAGSSLADIIAEFENGSWVLEPSQTLIAWNERRLDDVVDVVRELLVVA